MKLIIQIPCYNEEETLHIALNDLPEQLDGIDEIETLIIDDGSSDGTVEAAKKWGVSHIVRLPGHKGLAAGFMAGITECLKQGADIIVNTDADNQYCGADIARLVQPILENKGDVVLGVRPIDTTEDFSPLKKKLQHLGSRVVSIAAGCEIPDAASGFRAYSRDAALRLQVRGKYSYTIETLIQEGRGGMNIVPVDIRTNRELRPSRLLKSMWSYVKRSAAIVIHSSMVYNTVGFFSALSALLAVLSGIGICLYLLVNSGMVMKLLTGVLCTLLALSLGCTIGGVFYTTLRKQQEEVLYNLKKIEFANSPQDM